MTPRTLIRIIVALLIAAILGGASLIVVRNGSAVEETPAGFLH